jgi:acyl carrier protein phosphodiesterase
LPVDDWLRFDIALAELHNMANLMARREVRMAELKDVIRKLRAQLEKAGLEPVADDPLKVEQE